MADDLPTESAENLAHALAQAEEQLSDEKPAASTLSISADHAIYAIDGIGRYSDKGEDGWAHEVALIEVLHPQLDFSREHYPLFDRALADRFHNPALTDAHDLGYETLQNLRLNLAAVRNFLMRDYFDPSNAEMTRHQAETALNEIAVFLGEGLHNDWQQAVLNQAPKARAAIIHLDLASEPFGAGASYLYQKLLDYDRQSDWMRPFSAVTYLFGGSPPPNWMLPEQPVTAADQALDTIEDLTALADDLLFTAEHIDTITQLSEPVRHDAIEIAKEILRKLKFGLGDFLLMSGLNLVPTDNISGLGAIKGVVTVYERLLAWGRKIDGSIINHPSIIAANQAIGHLGYQAMREAARLARLTGNNPLISSLEEKLKTVPKQYTASWDKNFGVLFDKLEQGIDTVLNRTPNISGPGAKVGHTPNKEPGAYMAATPVAGTSLQTGIDGVAKDGGQEKRNFQIQQTQDQALLAQAQRMQAQAVAQARSQGQQPPAANTPNRAATGRQALAQARSQTSAQTNTSPNAQQSNAQRQQAALRNAAALQAHHDEEQHQRENQQRQQQDMERMAALLRQQDAQKSAALKKAAQNIQAAQQNAAKLNTAPVTVGRQSPSQSFYGPPSAKPATPKPNEPPKTPEELQRQQQALMPPPPVKPNPGRGI